MRAEFYRRNIKVSGVRLEYVERESAAESSQPPLLLLHGLIATAETMAASFEGLPDDRRIVALDILSAGADLHGKAPELSFSSLASLIVRFATAVGLERPVLLGHSHGGALAVQIAAQTPDVPSGLILLCPAHPFGGYSASLVRFYLTPLGRVFARLLPLIPSRWFNVSRLAGPRSTISREQVERYRQALCLPATIPRVLHLLKSWERDMRALAAALRARPISVPVLLLWGDHDPAVLIASAPALERFLPQSERVTLQGVGHLPADEAGSVCVNVIGLWLNRHNLQPPRSITQAESGQQSTS